jgi:hypothetical protein
LGLPIKKITSPKEGCDDIEKLKASSNDVTVAFEIDLSQPKKVQQALGLTKMDCFPVLWVFQELEMIKWPIRFDQNIACKYLAFKLIDIHRNPGKPMTNYSHNMEMFAL